MGKTKRKKPTLRIVHHPGEKGRKKKNKKEKKILEIQNKKVRVVFFWKIHPITFNGHSTHNRK